MLGDDEDDSIDTPAERAYRKAMAGETNEERLNRLYIPHEGTARERTDQIAARRAGEKLWAQICDLLRKKVL